MPVLIDTSDLCITISFEEFKSILEEDRPKRVIFDIETGPQSITQLEKIFDESKVRLPKHPGEFDARSIRYGNAGEEKRREKYDRVLREHQQACRMYEENCIAAKKEAFDSFVDDAPKSAVTGRVISIGYGIVDSKGLLRVFLDIDDKDEFLLLSRLWAISRLCTRGKLIGFGSNSFDIPFCVQRSWILSKDLADDEKLVEYAYNDLVKPSIVAEPPYFKYPDYCVDILKVWEQGSGWKHAVNLRTLAIALGVREKFDEVEGKYYWKKLKEDRDAAEKYLYRDIIATYDCAKRLNLV